jgi:cell division protein FtsI (penicillin-binding protein 3)
MEQNGNRILKIIFLFLFILIGAVIFLFAVFKTIVLEDKHMPKLIIKDRNIAIRGSIISKDGYQIAYSNKLYEVSLNPKYLNPNKKELFVNLLSIYSDIPKKEIREKIKEKGNVVLSYKIDTKRAYQLKVLARKLNQMDVFIPVDNKNHKEGLSILESGETRVYPYKDFLTPAIGYVQKDSSTHHKYIIPKSIKGLEKYYDRFLKPKQDGVIKGKRDIGNNIILNKEALIKKRVDGLNLHLNVDMLLQKNLEFLLDTHKKDLEAKEIIAAVMDSSTGKILAIVSSNRYDPKNIKRDDVPNLDPKFTEYEFEPGSVMKPITFALLLENKLVSPLEIIKGFKGRYKLGKKVITDEHKFEWLSAENVIVYSSNIGMAQLAQRLPKTIFYNGLRKFGFGSPSGIDLSTDKSGTIVSLSKLSNKIYKSTLGYGYGIKVTFIQLLKAYNVFNNEGIMQVPKIGDFLTKQNGKRMDINFPLPERVISQKSALTIKEILKKVVEKGTGKVAKIEGLEIGGKTGTAHIVKNKEYVKMYNSSFFGFANDKNHRYTIGVTVIEPKNRYFASQTAAPIFREIVMELLNEGYLNINR